MNVIDIAYETWTELGEPDTITPNVIAFWLRTNVGQLNAAINTVYYINSYREIERVKLDNPTETELIGINEAAVFKKIYHVDYFDQQIRRNMISYTNSPVIQASADGHTIRLASPTEIGKNLSSFRKQSSEDLANAITSYKIDKSTPNQITGDDYIAEGE